MQAVRDGPKKLQRTVERKRGRVKEAIEEKGGVERIQAIAKEFPLRGALEEEKSHRDYAASNFSKAVDSLADRHSIVRTSLILPYRSVREGGSGDFHCEVIKHLLAVKM